MRGFAVPPARNRRPQPPLSRCWHDLQRSQREDGTVVGARDARPAAHRQAVIPTLQVAGRSGRWAAVAVVGDVWQGHRRVASGGGGSPPQSVSPPHPPGKSWRRRTGPSFPPHPSAAAGFALRGRGGAALGAPLGAAFRERCRQAWHRNAEQAQNGAGRTIQRAAATGAADLQPGGAGGRLPGCPRRPPTRLRPRPRPAAAVAVEGWRHRASRRRAASGATAAAADAAAAIWRGLSADAPRPRHCCEHACRQQLCPPHGRGSAARSWGARVAPHACRVDRAWAGFPPCKRHGRAGYARGDGRRRWCGGAGKATG